MAKRISIDGADHMVRERIVPTVVVGRRVRFDAQYVDKLAELLSVMALDEQRRYDPDFGWLYFLAHRYATLEDGPRRAEKLSYILDRLDTLVKSGKVVPLAYLLHELFTLRPSTIRNWVAKGRIATVNINGTRYLTTRHADRIIWAVLECELVSEAALRLNVSPDKLGKAVLVGRVPAFMGPEGLLRINPKKVPSLPWYGAPDGITLSEMARRLGITRGTVTSAAGRGVIRTLSSRAPSARKSYTRIVPYDEFSFWEQRFTTLQPGFEWLQQKLQGGRSPVVTCTRARVVRITQTSEQTVARWSDDGLLPHYIRSFGGNKVRHFVVSYIDGLAAFAGALPVEHAVVVAYAKACAEARAIL
ncbi:MAG TPA: hypothetical protein VLA88_05985 [Candidatus Saccharimonadales bacterium]|nr:hypothetical protein [Candidatus Saccharimonadales bacterium]